MKFSCGADADEVPYNFSVHNSAAELEIASRVQLDSVSVDPLPIKPVNIPHNLFQYLINQATDVPLNALYYVKFPKISMTTASYGVLIMLADIPAQASIGQTIPARAFHSHFYRQTIATK